MTLTVGSLFSGIGGLDLGLERAGMKVIWQSEIDPYGCRVLKKHWPEVPNHGNIKEINWGDIVRPDIICGGYPCQPFSTAGKRNGTEDPRHLWPWVRQAISELRPKYAILENVRGHISLGLSTVLGEMASIGYDAEWQIVSAASQGASHLRERVVIVAYPNDSRGRTSERRMVFREDALAQAFQKWTEGSFDGTSGCRCNVANTSGERCEEPLRTNEGTFVSQDVRRSGARCGPLDSWWKTEPNVGRVADGIPSRLDRLRGLGNAVVPQVAEFVGRVVISHYEDSL